MSSCQHSQDEKKTAEIVNKHVKIIHKISTKMSTMIRAAGDQLTHSNFNKNLILIMRELNKHKLYGSVKRDMAIMCIQLLMDSFGIPDVVSHYTAEIIVAMIEDNYHNGFHRFRRPHRLRFWKR